MKSFKNFHSIQKCRSCSSKQLTKIFNLGYQCFGGIFPPTKKHYVPTGPLELVKCSKCDFHYLNPRIRSSIIIDSYKMNPDLEFVKYNKYRLKTFQLNMNRIKRILKIKSFT